MSFTHLPRHRLLRPGDIPDSAGGLYNPGAWIAPDGAVKLMVRREATHPPFASSVAPVVSHEGWTLSLPLEILGHHTGTRLEDFRPILDAEGRVVVVHTCVRPGSPIQPGLSVYDPAAHTLTRLDDLQLLVPLQPVEKNWVLFAHQDRLHLVYSLDPLVICVNDGHGPWAIAQIQPTDWGARLGKPPRNSTNLIPFEGGYLGWWHTQLDRTYVTGAYWLDAQLRLRARTGILFNGQAVTDGFKPGCLYLSSQVWPKGSDHLALFFGEGDAFTSVCHVRAAAVRDALWPTVSTSPRNDMNLDDLDPTPLDASGVTDLAARESEVEGFLIYLGQLADDGPTSFAADTLLSMRETIRATRHVTEGQRRAVANIVRGARDAEASRERNARTRRYEGWEP